MGIKGFTQIFGKGKVVKLKDFKGKTIAVDALAEIQRAIRGMSSVRGLTDANGNPTLHIMVILSNIIEMKKNDITPIWVFDYYKDGEFNQEKMLEHAKREEARIKAREEKARLEKELQEHLTKQEKAKLEFEKLKNKKKIISNIKKESKEKENKEKENELKSQIEKQEKRSFNLSSMYVNDVKLILNMFNITWIMAPKGCEAEKLCAILCKTKKVDNVLSIDSDTLAFGSPVLIRRNPRERTLNLYELDKILKEKDITFDQFIDVCITMGTDFNEKVKGIGAKTVIKKIKDGKVAFDEKQKNARKIFTRDICPDLEFVNQGVENYSDKDKIKKLIHWLIYEKGFSDDKLQKKFKIFE